MKQKLVEAHMACAEIYSQLSTAERLKVGCVIVKDDTIIAIGYNGTPKGEHNVCEDRHGYTLPNVIHAEDNALRKLTKSELSSSGASLFVTHTPCLNCGVRIVDAGIKDVYYKTEYLGENGLQYMINKGVNVIKI